MPNISQFYGIIINMYFQQAEHNPPHVHAIYGDSVAVFSIKSGKILEGELPEKAINLVQEWIEIHKDEIMEIWDTQHFRKIEPLK